MSILAEFRRCLDLVVAGQLAETLSSTKKNGFFESFGEEEEENDESDTTDPEELIEGPPPSIGLSGETTLVWREFEGKLGPTQKRNRETE